ncbi:hypothetical protein ACRZOU_002467 [Aeromonas salmonicida]
MAALLPWERHERESRLHHLLARVSNQQWREFQAQVTLSAGGATTRRMASFCSSEPTNASTRASDRVGIAGIALHPRILAVSLHPPG